MAIKGKIVDFFFWLGSISLVKQNQKRINKRSVSTSLKKLRPFTYIIVRIADMRVVHSQPQPQTVHQKRWYIGIFNRMWMWERDGTYKGQHMWVLHYPPAPAVSQWNKEPPESRCQVPDSIQVRAQSQSQWFNQRWVLVVLSLPTQNDESSQDKGG